MFSSDRNKLKSFSKSSTLYLSRTLMCDATKLKMHPFVIAEVKIEENRSNAYFQTAWAARSQQKTGNGTWTHKVGAQSRSQRAPAGKWYNAALLVISCCLSNFVITMSHMGPLPLFNCRKTRMSLKRHISQSNCTRLIRCTHWQVNWLRWMFVCFPAWVIMLWVCVLSYRAGRLEQMVSPLLKG